MQDYETLFRARQNDGTTNAELRFGDGHLLVSEWGGRIFGPFLDGHSLSWNNPNRGPREGLDPTASATAWNQGGDRIWLAPELRYNVRDRTRFLESYDLQASVDPGQYKLSVEATDRVRLSQDLQLRTYDRPLGAAKRLHISRTLKPASDPMRHVASYETVRGQVLFSGLDHTVTLSDLQPDGLESQAWSIQQVPPGGQILVPTTGLVEYQDHLEPVDGQLLQVKERELRICVTGDRMFKIEVKAANHYGRYGYYREIGDGRATLLAKLFFNNPSADYVMEAPHRPGIRGYSLDIYNDDGGLGGYGEMECHGQPIGSWGGATESTNQFLTWAYLGPRKVIAEISSQLLGVRPEMDPNVTLPGG